MKLSLAQKAALLFALHEGEVGPGCDALLGSFERFAVRRSTLRALERVGYLVPKVRFHENEFNTDVNWYIISTLGRGAAMSVAAEQGL